MLEGDVWLADAFDPNVFTIAAGQNVNLEAGRLMIEGDRTALIDALLDGRLTGYGSSANIVHDQSTYPGWTTVTAIPEPATMGLLGFAWLLMLKRRRA